MFYIKNDSCAWTPNSGFFQLLILIIIVTVMVVVIVIVTIMVIVIVACKTLVTVSAPSNDLIPVPGSLSVCVSAMSNHYPGLWVLFPCPYHHPVQSPSRSQSAFPLSLSLICFVRADYHKVEGRLSDGITRRSERITRRLDSLKDRCAGDSIAQSCHTFEIQYVRSRKKMAWSPHGCSGFSAQVLC